MTAQELISLTITLIELATALIELFGHSKARVSTPTCPPIAISAHGRQSNAILGNGNSVNYGNGNNFSQHKTIVLNQSSSSDDNYAIIVLILVTIVFAAYARYKSVIIMGAICLSLIIIILLLVQKRSSLSPLQRSRSITAYSASSIVAFSFYYNICAPGDFTQYIAGVSTYGISGLFTPGLNNPHFYYFFFQIVSLTFLIFGQVMMIMTLIQIFSISKSTKTPTRLIIQVDFFRRFQFAVLVAIIALMFSVTKLSMLFV